MPDDNASVDLVKRQYLQQIPVRYFKWPKLSPSLQSLLWEQVFAPGIHHYPPGERYQYLILRDFVTNHENEEVDERVLLRYTELLQSPPPVVPPTADTIITYIAPGLGEVYISEQPFVLVSGGTTGLRTWEASLLLSQWLLEQEIDGLNILELGAGTGLAGILAAKKGAHVLLTDGSDAVVSKLNENLALNGTKAEVQPLWWGEEDPILDRQWDYILGADITYDEDICASVAERYAQGLRKGGVGILAASVRNESTLQAFKNQCGRILIPLKLTTPDLRVLDVDAVNPTPNLTNTFFSGSTFPVVLLRIEKRS